MSDLNLCSALLVDVLKDLYTAIQASPGAPPDDLAKARVLVEDAARALNGVIRPELDTILGDSMDVYELSIDGVGTFTRHKHKSRTKWDKDALLSAVLDSRLVNPLDGEVADESPLDKVLDIWNLPAPRTTRLKARRIDADEFCTTEVKGGWKIEYTGTDTLARDLAARASGPSPDTSATAGGGAQPALAPPPASSEEAP